MKKLNETKCINLINEQMRNVIKELKDRFKADNINFGIHEDDFISNEKKEDDDDDDDDEDNNLEPSYILKMVYIYIKIKD